MSRLRRLGVALRLTEDPTTAISIRWEEPRAATSGAALPTRIPSTTRQLAIDIGELRAGDYVVAISMESARCTTVRSERPFRIAR